MEIFKKYKTASIVAATAIVLVIVVFAAEAIYTYVPTLPTYEQQYEYAKREYKEAYSYFTQGLKLKWQWAKALKALEKLEKQYPDIVQRDLSILLAIEGANYALERYARALSYLEKAQALFMKEGFEQDGEKDYAIAIFFYNAKADCYIGLKQYDQAIAQYEKIIGDFSDMPANIEGADKFALVGLAYESIIELYKKTNNASQAQKWAKKLETFKESLKK